MANRQQQSQSVTDMASPGNQPKRNVPAYRRILFRHEWIIRHLPYVFYLSCLALIYIANGHQAEKKIRTLNQLQKEVKALHWKYLEAKSDVMFQSKYSEVARQVAPWGWSASSQPPFVLVVDTTN
ncbi:MAG: hypothetical protein IRZ01_03600 [Thermoflavifilum aggregans]|nr:hypothetical protein [Thermoflavifilum aggregans]